MLIVPFVGLIKNKYVYDELFQFVTRMKEGENPVCEGNQSGAH